MNKNILIIVLILSCIVLSLFAWKMLAPKEEPILDQANRTFLVMGDVKVKRVNSQAKWQDMDTSTVLEKGDIVRTSKDSSADMIIGANVEKAIKLEENSSVEFKGINPVYLNLSRGKVRVDLMKLESGSSFTVKTPTAICGARGTAWTQQVEGDGTRICVFESNVFVRGIDADGKTNTKEYVIGKGTQRALQRGKAISVSEPISEHDISEWEYWSKNIAFLREDKVLVDDFNRKDNYNNLNGPMGSWNIFYSDPTQFCKDEFTDVDRLGDTGYGIKLTYDVDSQVSAYNGFFTNLMGIDISDYQYLIFSVKGDKKAGFTETVNIELKNKGQVGRTTVNGITDEWKKMIIPLNDFIGINDFKYMREFVIVFSDIKVSKKEGAIYIDDIYFAKDTGVEN